MNFIGIDFGTSNSLAALSQGAKIETLEYQGQRSIPTVLFFPATKTKFGQRNQPYFIGREAIAQRFDEHEAGRLLFSFKGLLADDSFEKTTIHGHGEFSAEKLCGVFLKKMKDAAEAQFGREFLGVVLGRPVEFSERAVRKLQQAAHIAGFRNISTQLEPIAAGLKFERSLRPSDGEKLVFISDIGGGTTDYAILRLSTARSHVLDRKDDILAVGGVYKAGDYLNSDILRKGLAERFGKGARWGEKQLEVPGHWIHALGDWKTLPFLRNEQIGSLVPYTEGPRKKDVSRMATLVQQNLGYQLHSEIDRAKITLSSSNCADVLVNALDLSEQITKKQFETLTQETVKEMQREIHATLQRAGLGPERISAVLMTGGSSLVPALQKMLTDVFDPGVIVPVDPFNSVVSGLAIEAEKHANQGSNSKGA